MLRGWKSTRARGAEAGALCSYVGPNFSSAEGDEYVGPNFSSANPDPVDAAELADAATDAAAPPISDFNTLRRDGRSDM
jgi:hypothetical protein